MRLWTMAPDLKTDSQMPRGSKDIDKEDSQGLDNSVMRGCSEAEVKAWESLV